MPSRPSSLRFKRRWIALAAGLLALCLQLGAQIMPAEAMQGAMRAAALTSEEAQSFAATCLGFGMPAKGEPAKPGQHASCPVCFTLAQSHGFAAPDVAFSVVTAWTRALPVPLAEISAPADTDGSAFYPQAPPAFIA
ncbi:hypothetical protein [Dongia rigui]|uniref:DUF2946 domain-containing protein n=1 Tax=Dongia rigui TaxID=940149 RepID=A0ABU5DXI6_9PROT|nr:hypothetical protein [Dongia rigui]MDY0871717.1 hypothetical protein [Dongia rigui]